VHSSGGYFPGAPGKTIPLPPDNLQLIFERIFQLTNTTREKICLLYGSGTWDACNQTTWEVPYASSLAVFLNDAIQLSIDSETRVTTNITVAESCAVLIGAIGIKKEVRTDRDKMCPILKPGRQPTQVCALMLDERFKNRIAAAMLYPIGLCVNQLWPNITGSGTPCLPVKSTGSKRTLYGSFWGTVLALAGATFLSLN
jgi:hypothetical protein